ncbi:MAG TPA: alpha-1,6-glucosidase domain-containing protein [Ideonella sp.]|nr:alpha-1,6-glucosidase domain-containing protein [Ideonella sp.]
MPQAAPPVPLRSSPVSSPWAQRLRLRRLCGLGLLALLSACGGGSDDPTPEPLAAATVRVHYLRYDGAYTGWGVYSWEGPKTVYSDWPSGDKYRFAQTDPWGNYVDIAIDTSKTELKFLLNKGTTAADAVKDGDCDRVVALAADIASKGQEVWIKQADCAVFPSLAAAGDASVKPLAAATMRIHYNRSDTQYDGWGVYSWEGPATIYSDWPSGDKYRFEGTYSDAFGRYQDIALDTSKTAMEFLLNKGTDGSDTVKDGDCDRNVAFVADIATKGQEIWLQQDDCAVYDSAASAGGLTFAAAQAMWISADTLVWPGSRTAGGAYALHYAADGGLAVNESGVSGATSSYTLAETPLSDAQKAQYPALKDAPAYKLDLPAEQVKALLKGQVAVTRVGTEGKYSHSTQLQIQGVLDDLYAAAAVGQTLGLSFGTDGKPSFRLWAPTARNVKLNVAGGSVDLLPDTSSGIWSTTGNAGWSNTAYYSYAVQVWSRTDGGAVKTYTVTDPYAVTLNAAVTGGAAQQAMVADLKNAAFKPAGWDAQSLPSVAAPEDIVLYELHIRDFSANDSTVPAALRGKYKAFAQTGADGYKHLQGLAGAGLTHVHLLPAFDIASVDEGGCTTPAIASAGPVSETPQASAAAAKDSDCFNWGYDPRHYAAPEGSYATDANDGKVRVAEFREMVQSLHGAGLSVVMDVVYNHTSGSFLDQIVPGYYYRLNGDGVIERSSCCENTAPEFAMMEKLMIDTLKTWAVEYKIDGFRFDIMGHIPKASMLKAQADVNAAAGRTLYYYGEAWNFGEVANDRLFVQARQANMGGTGIGSFSDRIRDAIRGGGPFDTGTDIVKNQGFASGLCTDPNGQAPACDTAAMNLRQDWIRLGLAGNLADFVLGGRKGSEIDYGGQPAGFTQDPQEVINYAGVHDGETLWDISQYKHPASTTSAERARAQVVALGTVLMGQGVPFIHAGDELLRSKAMDRDSYNAGDWFNRIDWTAGSNYFDSFGLPSAEKNQDNWELMKPFLQNANANPSGTDIVATREAVKDLLRVRRDTTMLRLRDKASVMGCVSFPDASAQVAGLVVMQVGKGDTSCGDGKYKRLVVMVNAGPAARSFTIAALQGKALVLHPLLAAGSDAVVKAASFNTASGALTVPARSVAVFVEP